MCPSLIGPWHEYELSKALFRRNAESSRLVPVAHPLTNRTHGNPPATKNPHSSRSTSSFESPDSSPKVDSTSDVPSQSILSQSCNRRRPRPHHSSRRPPRKCSDTSEDLAKAITDRLDMWTKTYTDPPVVSTQPAWLSSPSLPDLLDPDDSTLIEWGSNLDFTDIINTTPPA